MSDFFKNKGHHVFISLLIAKICGFLGSLLIIKILPESEFGTISIVASVFFIFMSFNGFGSNQILLRYGSIVHKDTEKKSLAKYLLRQGFMHQLIISLIFLLVSVFYINKYQDIFFIFVLFTVRLIGYYFLNHIQAEFRVFGNNKAFARVSNFVNIGGVLLLLLFSYFFGLTGYLLAIAATPFLCLLWYKKNHFVAIIDSINFTEKEIWSFGLHAAGTALLSDALFSADVLMLSFLMNETAVANYKVGLLIPINITFLASTFMQSDYTVLAKNSKNRMFLKNYIFNYYKIFIPTSLLIFILGYLFKSEIFNLFFDEKYYDNQFIFVIFLATFSFNMLLRNLYGNLLSAVGMMKMNTAISLLNLIMLLSFAFIFVKKFGVVGMAISLSSSLVISGFFLLFSFYLYWKDLK
ncbi:oligosaccharide flippase family protein [Kaistella sp. SH11-4b]|nr:MULTISPECIES: oligosaccharide flippase family protein [unclassified Kaistella]MDP2452773.1 oligosaccharide flippase family protein [Kaistella sp. SH11-4b]MDP2455682.1 oligosaccharide flippase family protein [Kaistella sp. SH40-3]MDP2458586.1 oligosaccharide flippase family protein [Kaistella sp. SH19-2b]